MSNGAAGCGYENRNTGGKCGHLSVDLAGFACLKYRVPLDVAKQSGDPFRCKQCGDDANKDWDSHAARQRAAETALVRNKIASNYGKHARAVLAARGGS